VPRLPEAKTLQAKLSPVISAISSNYVTKVMRGINPSTQPRSFGVIFELLSQITHNTQIIPFVEVK
jgi:hypothetical protein